MNIYMIVCLGYGEMELIEVAKNAINNARPESYLFGKTEEEFVQHFYDLTTNDRLNQQFCAKNDIPYFITAGDRNAKLQEAVAYIIERYTTG